MERLGRSESLLCGETLDLPAELCAELAVVAGDQGAPVERQVAGRDRVDGPADDVGDDEVAGVDRAMVGLSGEALGPRCQRQQRRVPGEVRGRAGRRFGERARARDGQPGAGEPEGENLIGRYGRSTTSPRRARRLSRTILMTGVLRHFRISST